MAELLAPSDHSSACPWKTTASYKSIVVDGQRNENALWFYPAPEQAAEEMKDRVAFGKGVTVAAWPAPGAPARRLAHSRP